MKNKLKSLLAVFLSIACVLATTPVLGFAAENNTLWLNGTSITDSEGNALSETPKANSGDTIQKLESADEGFFTVYINGKADSEAANYAGAASSPSYTNPEDAETATGNTYYDKYTVPAAPEGYKDGAEISISAVEEEKLADGKSPLKVKLTYAPEEYTVTYYLSENETFGEAQTYKYGDEIIPPTAPVKEGYDFAGWILGTGSSESDEYKKLPEKMPAENLSVYASWTLKNISISFISDGNEVSKTKAPYGSDISATVPDDPSKDGYIFAGWLDAEGNNVYSYKTIPATDTVFTAKWLKNGNVTYMVGDKTYETYEVKEGDKIPVPEENPKKFGQVFKGWEPEIPDAMPAEDQVFTAKFEVDKEFVTIVIGGTVIAGGVIAGLGAAAITGISIVGGIIALLGVASNINKAYTVTYKVDGEVYKTYSVASGKEIPVPEKPEKDGFEFVGWTPEIPDKMPKKNMTFEAEWSEKDTDIPSTGSAAAGVAALAALGISSAIAVIFAKKKKDNK